MSSKAQAALPATKDFELPRATNPDSVKSVYVNHMEIAISPMDARLNFNEVISDGKSIQIERRASVVMSIPHLKAMAQVLAQHVPAEKEDLPKKD
jgi:hypothetical protein